MVRHTMVFVPESQRIYGNVCMSGDDITAAALPKAGITRCDFCE